MSDVPPPPLAAPPADAASPPPPQTPFHHPPLHPPTVTAKTAAGGHHYTTAAHAGDKKPKNLKGSGGVKKGGAGGKFTWGNVLDEEGLSTLDRWVAGSDRLSAAADGQWQQWDKFILPLALYIQAVRPAGQGEGDLLKPRPCC